MNLRLLALLVPALLLSASAQPSATMRPALLEDFTVESSFSSREDLDRGDTPVGDAAIMHYGFGLSLRHALNADTTLAYGVAFSTHEIDSTNVLLPDRLTEATFNLGVQHRFSPQWSGALYARPGFYSDFERFTGRAVNVPVLLFAHYHARPELAWSFGVTANSFSDNPVIPILGVRWQFAPDWTFNLGFPRSGFTRKISDSLSVRAAVAFVGGSFRLTQSLGEPAPGVGRLANTYVDFREVRAGLGADLTLGEGFALTVDAGAVTDRKFDFFDRNYRLDADGGLFVALSFKGSY